MDCNIMVIKINSRKTSVPQVQTVLTEFGCSIKTRLGLHEAGEVCSDEGILILQLVGEREEMKKLEIELTKLDGIKAQMVLL